MSITVLKFRLQRFVALTPMKSGLQIDDIAFAVGGVNISLQPIPNTTSPKLLMVAETFFDAESIDGLNDANVVLSRERAELAISEAVSILCAIAGAGFRLESCHPFFAVDWPSGSDGNSRVAGDWVIKKLSVDPEINISQISTKDAITLLSDRSTGAKLLAQGLSTSHSIGRFLSFCQLFENGFAAQLEQLGSKLALFLEGANLGYSPDEVMAWLKIRGSAAHGDLKRAKMIANEDQVSQLIRRMQQAAYDVLMNKRAWHTADVSRRDAWFPNTAVGSEPNKLVLVAGVPTNVSLQLLDPFTKWPIANDCKIEPSVTAKMPTVVADIPMQTDVRERK